MQAVRIKHHSTSLKLFHPECVPNNAIRVSHVEGASTQQAQRQAQTQRAEGGLDFASRDSSHRPVSSVCTAAMVPVTNDHAHPRTTRVSYHRPASSLQPTQIHRLGIYQQKLLSIGMHTHLCHAVVGGQQRMFPLFAEASFQTAL